MLLTEAQRDALSEVINIGFGRSAHALSMLVGQRILLEAPDVDLVPVAELETSLKMISGAEITTIHQVFSGRIAGDAMLIMDGDSAAILVDLLNGGQGVVRELQPADQEALSETGNILLNAFIGSFGNLLQVHISFTVPHLRIESLKKMLRSLVVEKRGVEYAVIVQVHFRLAKGDVNGYVVIVMGIQSIEALLDSLKTAGYIT